MKEMAVARSGYVGFGSFHSDNVEELIGQSDREYQSPTIPPEVSLPDFPSYEAMMTSFLRPLQELGEQCYGSVLLEQGIFMLDRKWTFLNHGAFGAACTPALKAAEHWRRYAETQPLLCFDRVLLPQLVRIVRLVSTIIGARSCTEVVLVPNATQGLWSAIQSAAKALQTDDTILTLNICYGSVKRMVAEVVKLYGLKHHEVVIPLPPDVDSSVESISDKIVALVENALSAIGCVRLVLLDGITSNTAISLPVQRITDLCHRHGAAVIVDAAHALGQMDMTVIQWDADIVVGNFHKWWCSPRGAAFMWWSKVRATEESSQHQCLPPPRPLVISHGFGHGMLSEFSWDGNRDYSSWLALDATAKFWDQIGVEKTKAYCHGLLRNAVALLLQRWSTRTLVPLEMCSMMALVELPMHTSRTKTSTVEDGTPGASVEGKILFKKLSFSCYSSKLSFCRAQSVRPQLDLFLIF